MNDQFQAIREILDIYPDLYNAAYPHSIKCPPGDGDDVTLPFKKNLPKFFKIENVEMTKRENSRCIWRVTYMPKDGNDLPSDDNKLKQTVSYLMKYAPSNAIILEEEREMFLPNRIIIPYGVLCHCTQHFLDQAALRAQAQLEKQLELLQMNNYCKK